MATYNSNLYYFEFHDNRDFQRATQRTYQRVPLGSHPVAYFYERFGDDLFLEIDLWELAPEWRQKES